MQLQFPYEEWSIQKRVEELTKAYSSREAMLGFVSRCKEDRAYFVNNCIDTLNERKREGDPGNRGNIRPFLLCLRQCEALEQMRHAQEVGYDVVWPKSRNVGLSWKQMQHRLFNFLFTEGYSSLVGSRNDDLVDPKGAGDMNALFPKFDFMYSRLPRFMQIKEYGIPNGGKPYKVEMLRVNPLNGARIRGEAVTEHFGAGPRADDVLIDELSRCLHGKSGWQACGQTTDSRHGVFTSMGKDFAWSLCCPDEYMQMTNTQRVERPKVFRMHYKDIPWQNRFLLLNIHVDLESPPWRREDEFEAWLQNAMRDHLVAEGNGYSPFDPIGCPLDGDGIPFGAGYDDGRGNIDYLSLRQPIATAPIGAVSAIYPWRIREGFRYDEVKAAQELDCKFDDSKQGRVYSIQFRMVKKEQYNRNPRFPLYATCDPGRSFGNAFYMAWVQWNDDARQYEYLRELTCEGRSAYFFLPFLTGRLSDAEEHFEDEKAEPWHWEFLEEFRHPAWRVNMLYGDPAGLDSVTANTKFSIRNIFSQGGVPVHVDHSFRGFEARVPAARRIMSYTAIDKTGCPRLLMALSQIAYPEIKENTQRLEAPRGYVHHPIFSHPCAAFEYFACADPHRYDLPKFDIEDPAQRDEYMESRRRERNAGWNVEIPRARSRAGYW